ncbi:hypothetical protein [Puniceicoccus vermicola]|uniref:Ferritin-like domain-containing protein n=1 Tax=Puniceicoccus vermicola TaxID=388746 RepID=A0A7X1B0K1_9BACT|nr:hypothetical protein [Puniceicoccus vermicola]MBC2603401.1 hypothetical protein [Puniceicoccus vermicola]
MKAQSLNHPALVKSLRKAYSAEKAAAFAYIGHASSLKEEKERTRIREIENDEWEHRREVGVLLDHYGIPRSRFYEWKYHLIGKCIGLSCHLIGRFMPYFFAGKLESGNVCEYFVMIRYFHELGIHDHDDVLHAMGIKEKEHEVYFLELIADEPWLPWFEKVFEWGKKKTLNDVDLADPLPPGEGDQYCRSRGNGVAVSKKPERR